MAAVMQEGVAHPPVFPEIWNILCSIIGIPDDNRDWSNRDNGNHAPFFASFYGAVIARVI
jgi:hypothetical protein